MTIYLVCETCADTYYAGHPTKVAFNNRSLAEEFIKSKMADDDFADFYIKEIVLVDTIDAANNFFKS